MAKQTLYMETTEISPVRTAGEIISELVEAGANQINQTFEQGRPTGIRWVMRVGGADVLFDMPVRVEPVYKIFLSRNKKTWLSDKDKRGFREKAERVAWRQLLRWTQAQVAMIQTGMVQPGEVFLAYMFDPGKSRTLFQTMMETQFKALPPAS